MVGYTRSEVMPAGHVAGAIALAVTVTGVETVDPVAGAEMVMIPFEVAADAKDASRKMASATDFMETPAWEILSLFFFQDAHPNSQCWLPPRNGRTQKQRGETESANKVSSLVSNAKDFFTPLRKAGGVVSGGAPAPIPALDVSRSCQVAAACTYLCAALPTG